VSSLMAKQLVRKILTEDNSVKVEDVKVDFSFFTAGMSDASDRSLDWIDMRFLLGREESSHKPI